jgi:hypothetical protein
MNLRTPAQTLLPLLSACLLAACASDDVHRRAETPEEPPDMAALMAESMRLGTPAEEHARLAEQVGKWKVSGAFYMEPGGEPQPMEATAETKTLLGGRIVQETFRSQFMGMPFEGLLLQGYDNLKGHYWTVWYDNMSTWGSYSTGNYDGEGRLVLEGTMYDAMTPKGRKVRTVITEQDEDHANMKMFDVSPDGEAAMTMDLNYTRQ